MIIFKIVFPLFCGAVTGYLTYLFMESIGCGKNKR
jgi:hypothetical protein